MIRVNSADDGGSGQEEVTDVRANCLMTTPEAAPDELIGRALAALRGDPATLQAALEALPAPIYVTDADGWVTYFNRACVGFAGRRPQPGQDRWCVTWRLYTEDGVSLPQDECPMAVAVRERRPVRGIVAVAERPDGSRVMFTPFPTPVFDEGGAFTGAVNLLIDVTDSRQADSLRAQARRCRRLAASVTDSRTIDTLMMMAGEYEHKAHALSRG